MISARRLEAAVLCAAACIWPASASAQTAEQSAAAQVLFEQGKTLLERGNVADACPKFAESLHLDPGVGTMLWLADCLETNGQTASAWARFKEAAAAAALQHDARERVARARAVDLEPRLSRLTIVVPRQASIPGLEVRRDGILVGHAEWGVAVPLDPGVHAIAASAPGREGWSSTVRVQGRDTVPVTIPVLQAGAAPTPVPPTPGDAPPAAGRTQRILGLSLAGVGVLAAGAGAYLGFRAKSVYDGSNADGHCLPDNQCDPVGKQRRDDAHALALGSTIAIGVGAAAIVGGGLLFLTAPDGTPRVAVAPAVTRAGGGLSVAGSW